MGNTNHYNGLRIFGGLDINGAFVLPITDGSNGQVLQTDGLGNVTWGSVSGGTGSGSTSPAGSDSWVQFNDSGSFDASSAFTFSPTTGLTANMDSGGHTVKTGLGIGNALGLGFNGASIGYQNLANITGASTHMIFAMGDFTPLGQGDYRAVFGYYDTTYFYSSLLNITPSTLKLLHRGNYGSSTLSLSNDIDMTLPSGTTNGFSIITYTGNTLFNVTPNNITFHDAYTFPTNDGSNGQSLTTDGSGTLTWGSTSASTIFERGTTGFTPGIYSTGFYGNSADGDGGSFAVGTISKAVGLSSMALGNTLRVYGNQSAALGGGVNEIGYGADLSAIIGGTNLELLSGASESVMLGGSDYTGTTSGTTYVPSIDIRNNITLNTSITASTANVGAATLPANPMGFIIVAIDGVDYKLPYYNT
jgi:hypothetical protein